MGNGFLYNDASIAFNEAKVALPEFNLNIALKIAIDVITKEKKMEEVIGEYGPIIAKSAGIFVKTFSHDAIRDLININMGSSSSETFKALSQNNIGEKFADVSLSAIKTISKYKSGGMDLNEVMKCLADSGLKDIVTSFIEAYGIKPEDINNYLEQLASIGSMAVACAAFAESHKILMSALEDASLAHEHRLMIEKECEKSILYIREYRSEIQRLITEYFTQNLELIDNAFSIMGKTLSENDSNGFIKANNSIQEAFGYKVQFTNQVEFDNLMDSDVSFKL